MTYKEGTVPMQDNPIGNVFDKFFGKPKIKDVSDYINRLNPLNEPLVEGVHMKDKAFQILTGMSYLFDKKDRYNILHRMHEGGLQIAKDPLYLGKAVSEDTRIKGLDTLFQHIHKKYGLNFAYDRKAKDLFMLTEQGMQFALPIQSDLSFGSIQHSSYPGLDSGLVRKGGKTRGAYRFRYIDSPTEISYSDAFYDRLKAIAYQGYSRQKFLREVAKIDQVSLGTGVKGKLRLGALLSSNVNIRGSSIGTRTAKTHAMRMRVINRGDDAGPDLAIFAKYKQARADLNLLTKYRGIYIPDHFDPGTTALEAFDMARRDAEQFSGDLENLFTKLGLQGMHPLTKADFLLGDKGLIVASNLGKAMRGQGGFSERELKKGVFQDYHASTLTSAQKRQIRLSGTKASPGFLTEAEMYGSSVDDYFFRRRTKIAVASFKDEIGEFLALGDSGSLATHLGTYRTAMQRNIASFKIRSPDSKVLAAIGKLGGFANPRGENTSGAISIPWKRYQAAASRLGDEGYIPTRYLTSREKALRTLIRASGRKSGAFAAAARFSRGEKNIALSTSYSGSDIRVNFLSAELEAAATNELLIGGVRTTSTVPTSSVTPSQINPLTRLTRHVGNLGAEFVVSEATHSKMTPSQVITHYLGVMESRGKLKLAFDKLGIESTAVAEGENIPIINDPASALSAVQAHIKELYSSKSKKDRSLAKVLEHGEKVALSKLGLKGIVSKVRTFYADMSIRSDYMMDQNAVNAAKITPGKIRMLALSSKMMGYNNPHDDPIFRAFAGRMSSGFSFNGRTMDFDIGPNSPIKEYVKAIATQNYTPSNNIITAKGGHLYLDGNQLRDLPSLDRFRKGNLGVGLDELKGTVLDESLRHRILYMDLGESISIDPLGQGVSSRYQPLPMAFSRVGASDTRFVMNKDHPFFGHMQSLEEFQGGSGLTKDFVELLRNSSLKSATSLIGKEGLMAKMNTIHLKESMPIRLTAQSSPQFNRANVFDSKKFFEGSVSRKAFNAEFLKKLGYKTKEVERVLKIAKERDFMYVILGADPAQRPEHLGSVFKIHFSDKPVDSLVARNFGLDLQMNPLAKRMLERDDDRDKIFMHMIQAMMGDTDAANEFLEKRMTQQSQMIEPAMALLKAELTKAQSYKKSGKSYPLKDLLSAYVGQKSWASFGYTITRPDERLLHTLVHEGAEGLTSRGISLGTLRGINESHIQYVQSLFKNNPEREGAAIALTQYLFQGGVTKGQEKSSLLTLERGLLEISTASQAKGINLAGAHEEASKLLLQFIEGSDKERFYLTAEHLLQNYGGDKESLQAMKAALASGAPEALEKYRNTIFRGAASLMAHVVGTGAAIGPHVGGFLSSVTSITEGQTRPFQSGRSWWSRFVNPIIGNQTISPPSQGDGTAASVKLNPLLSGTNVDEPTFKGTLKNIKSDLLKNLESFTKSKYFVPALVGTAALSAYGYMSRPNFSNDMPPPIDTSRPTDRGPELPDYSNVARVNTSKMIAPASRRRHNHQMNPVSSNYFNSRTDSRVIVEDRVAPTNPWLVRQQMDRVSNSDFVV